MGEILGFIFGLILLILYFALILTGLAIVLFICGIVLTGGAIVGVAFGIVMGIKDYFAALFSQVKFRQ